MFPLTNTLHIIIVNKSTANTKMYTESKLNIYEQYKLKSLIKIPTVISPTLHCNKNWISK